MVYLRWYKLWRFVFIFGLAFQLWCDWIPVASGDDVRTAEIEIDSGRIRGRHNVTVFDAKPYFSFRGIPYGRAPLNELRFKAPKKVSPWLDTFDAYDYGNDCIQIDFQTNEFFGTEDCLNLNVFVPADAIESIDTTHANLSVMVFIQGEAFQSGSAKHYAPDFLIEKDVIVVTFNYRLGAIGHLSLNLPDYSGNQAFKDQVLVLKWVNENIGKFGGDSNKVTLFGHGSGAISVSLHTISPLSQSLFQNAIMLSGSALNPSIPRVRDHLPILYNLAENLHYPVDNNRDLIEFLRQIDGTMLTQRTYQDFSNHGFGRRMANLIWSAVVEHPHAPEPFLSKTPFDILMDDSYESKLNTLFSCTFEEMYGEFIDELLNPTLLRSFDEVFELQLPLRNAKLKFHSNEYKEVSRRVRELYFRGNRVDNDTITGFYALMTDVWFLYGIDLNARIQANKSSGHTYFSTFSVKSPWNLSTRKGKQYEFQYNFSHHFDQVPYIFRFSARKALDDSEYSELAMDSQERTIIDTLSKFYTNFAKFGNPLPYADPIEFKANATDDKYNYLDITNTGVVAKINPNRERIEFWNDIFDTYSQHWQQREFNLNSLAVKIPLLALALLLFSILCCKGINTCLHGSRKSLPAHHG